jgi:hypothetical protein
MNSKHQVVGRDMAQASGLIYFYTGVPCMRGHDTLRYVTNGACRDCTNRKRGPQGTNVIPITIILESTPTLEERAAIIKLMATWGNYAWAEVRKEIAQRSTDTRALDERLKAEAAQRERVRQRDLEFPD